MIKFPVVDFVNIDNRTCTKLRYIMDDILLSNCIEEYSKIGSRACNDCEHFVSQNHDKLELVCRNPIWFDYIKE